MQLTCFSSVLTSVSRGFFFPHRNDIWLFDCPSDDKPTHTHEQTQTQTPTSKWVNEVQTSCDYQSGQEMPNNHHAFIQLVTDSERPTIFIRCSVVSGSIEQQIYQEKFMENEISKKNVKKLLNFFASQTLCFQRKPFNDS